MFDHQVDAKILRVPVLVRNNDLFVIVLVSDGLGLSNPVRSCTRDLVNSKVLCFVNSLGGALPSGAAKRIVGGSIEGG
jgi:hypothetical protein